MLRIWIEALAPGRPSACLAEIPGALPTKAPAVVSVVVFTKSSDLTAVIAPVKDPFF